MTKFENLLTAAAALLVAILLLGGLSSGGLLISKQTVKRAICKLNNISDCSGKTK